MGSQLLTVSATAARLALSPLTVRRLIAAGRLPAVRVGRRAVRVTENDLEALVRLGYAARRSTSTAKSRPVGRPQR